MSFRRLRANPVEAVAHAFPAATPNTSDNTAIPKKLDTIMQYGVHTASGLHFIDQIGDDKRYDAFQHHLYYNQDRRKDSILILAYTASKGFIILSIPPEQARHTLR